MNTFFLIFIGLPTIEIFLMIKIGAEIGAFTTVALIILTAIIGIFYARVQGVQTLKSGITNLYSNKVPVYEILSGASIAFAALLLIVPGFLTDFFGFLLLIPMTRNILFRIIFKNKTTINKNKKKDTIEGEIIEKNKDEL